mmetsp:Transcript_30175/g.65939  ORF Transcript_30175/g.65939 Transcript_30175/m.65939 type:complete len:295 (-) Transcript_30175:155-1039(-)|eukprot:CAMPEP_0170620982 /NCGR_PEP_ID=MMETSP0224-20130122/28357_1 /TAXON_ID=285029 /ORGANISM="Togula jolla, Strain CCCM 725" /LENGTH=294 /DNA_ID=CAMNT_0010947209 /DNA_START=75 /DNA_END=959 /DNA_ORIENTATION=+
MVVVEDVLTYSLKACVVQWFDPAFAHPFFNIHTVSVPDSVAPIPKRWVDDVEVQLDEGSGGEDGDLLGDGPMSSWMPDSGDRLRDALHRLDLSEDNVAHKNLMWMSRHELGAEKRRVKQELKRYDADFKKQFSRLPSHSEKEPMRPLYVYYRRLKTMISQVEQSKYGTRRTGSGAGAGSDDDQGLAPRMSHQPLTTIQDLEETPREARERDLRRGGSVEDMTAALEARIESLHSEKGAVRAKLQAFQERFVSENNRKIRFHKDILPIEREYRMYKNLKEEIIKAEAQLRDLKSE